MGYKDCQLIDRLFRYNFNSMFEYIVYPVTYIYVVNYTTEIVIILNYIYMSLGNTQL